MFSENAIREMYPMSRNIPDYDLRGILGRRRRNNLRVGKKMEGSR